MSKILFSSDNSEKRLKPFDWVLNTSTNEIVQMTVISSVIFGNDTHLIKLELIGNKFILDNQIIGYLVDVQNN